MLLWHKHDVEKSLADLANFTPFPDEWTVEDKVLFEQAFSFHGKSFHRIQQMVSEKVREYTGESEGERRSYSLTEKPAVQRSHTDEY